MSACDAVRHDLGGYVLGGLADRDRAALDAHLAVCPACRAEAEELATLPGLLALTTEATPAPPEPLRARVLARARRWRRTRRAAVAAAAVLAVVAAAVAVGLPGTPPWLRPEPAAMTRTLTAGEGFDATGTASLVDDGARVRVHLELSGLEPLDEGVYEAWLSSGQGLVSLGGFSPRADGTWSGTLSADGPLDRYEQFWVTAEPDAVTPSHDGPTVVGTRLSG